MPGTTLLSAAEHALLTQTGTADRRTMQAVPANLGKLGPLRQQAAALLSSTRPGKPADPAQKSISKVRAYICTHASKCHCTALHPAVVWAWMGAMGLLS